MEWLVIAFVNFIIWIDRQFQRPLYKVVPDLDRLLHDPAAVLAEGPVTIGPKRSYAAAITLGLFLALLLSCGSLFWIKRVPGGAPPLARLLFTVMVLGFPLAFVLLMMRVLRGGYLTLTLAGAELLYRGVTVHCPWALFNAPGQPFLPDHRRIRLPVAPAAVPFVEARHDDALFARGLLVRTPQLRFPSAGEAVLRGIYEVDSEELGGLLLALGYLLGDSLPQDAEAAYREVPEVAPAAEPAVRGRRGWVTVRLTRLAFPPRCCGCGGPTRSVWKFRSRTFVKDDGVSIAVPVCDPCQRAVRRTRLRSLGWGAFLGFAAPLVLVTAPGILLGRPGQIAVGVFLALLGVVLGMWVGHRVGRRLTRLVQVRRYSPRKGTVAVRFRRPEYARDMLQAMHVPEEVGAGEGV